jgi:hypothetical protein
MWQAKQPTPVLSIIVMAHNNATDVRKRDAERSPLLKLLGL